MGGGRDIFQNQRYILRFARFGANKTNEKHRHKMLAQHSIFIMYICTLVVVFLFSCVCMSVCLGFGGK